MSQALSAQPVDSHLDQLSAKNFSRLSAFIHEYSGIKMPANKKTMLEGRLRRRMRTYGHASLNDYCRFLFEDDGLEAETVHLIDVVTTNKTEFFREPSHFDFLEVKGLPALAQGRRKPIRIWSAAASIGAEAYTLAMVLEDFVADRPGLDYQILATDICTDVLQKGVAGRYPEAMIEPVSMARRRQYLLQSKDRSVAEVRIRPDLRSKVAFGRLNLMDETYPIERDMDIVFCRNILIYFDKPTQAKVLSRLCDHLVPGGYLFLGHSESIVGLDLPVRQVANTVFQKP
ncbi:protein-glutamate O-methyltransferase CheR [Caulobacter segnis]|uniref:Chemotaxis protein methyltransferase n=1 Tax=Caulobacter segnis TaxID=88688 RepID=A0A2W5WGZ6_9CAUL|nr:CheR family methyltransferase [Caulobacter segnis]PZR32938.1 MAG: chemotaxis protein CheR [Caulobacter segnis]